MNKESKKAMNTSQKKTPYSWLKRIDEELIQLDDVPLFYAPVAFDFKDFSRKLSKELKTDIQITLSEKRIWREGEEIVEGLDDNCLFLPFSISPIEGEVFWVMSEKEIEKISHALLMKKEEKNGFSSTILQESFYRYLCLESLYILESMPTFENLSLKMSENVQTQENYALCMDVRINIGEHTCIGRLCLTQTFRHSWNEYFAAIPPIAEKGLEQNLDLIISIQAGYTKLSKETFNDVKPGDFILLDRASLDPKRKKGLISLFLGAIPLFHARIKNQKIKILDYAFYEEEKMKEEEENIPINEEEPISSQDINADEEQEEIVVSAVKPSLTSLKDTPITIVVEVARIRMTLDKILKLGPGNLLDLSLLPEQGVNLTVNGKIIGRAELINLGESIGIRILELQQ